MHTRTNLVLRGGDEDLPRHPSRLQASAEVSGGRRAQHSRARSRVLGHRVQPRRRTRKARYAALMTALSLGPARGIWAASSPSPLSWRVNFALRSVFVTTRTKASTHRIPDQSESNKMTGREPCDSDDSDSTRLGCLVSGPGSHRRCADTHARRDLQACAQNRLHSESLLTRAAFQVHHHPSPRRRNAGPAGLAPRR